MDDLFDIGGATARALDQGFGCVDEWDNGNGSLMRTVPLAFTDARDEDIEAVSAITHAHRTSTKACVELVGIARRLAAGVPMREATGPYAALAERPVREVRSGGFVRDTLEAALWCLLTTNNYRDCTLAAVNLGDDTDTTAAVAGALAGIVYGIEGIPAKWLGTLRGKNVIESCLF